MSSADIGARWVRAALQVNPFGYRGKKQPSDFFAGEDEYNSALLDECENLGIKLIAVTDHWSADTAAGLIAAAGPRGITALPGFEANSSEGVHLLVIFEVGTSTAEINAAIGICGATPGAESGPGTCSYRDILEKMTERGALVIPAHANTDSTGLLSRMSGQALEQMILHPDLHAIGITPGVAEATNQKNVIENRKPFQRKHPLAVVYADDIMGPADLAEVGSSCWLKLSSETLESVKHAVRTPQTRVRLEDPAVTPRVSLREISWTGGFLNQVTVPFSDDLTALIGGRGTGKSTVIESLRYALAITPIGKRAIEDHNMVVRDVLKSGTIIRVAVETVTPTPRRYSIERVVNEPPVVRDVSGVATPLRPVDVLPRVEIYGQHELAELAMEPVQVAQMLQRFTGSQGPDEAHQKTLVELFENRERFKQIEGAREALENDLSAIPRLEEQVRQYDQTDVPAKLADQQRLVADETVFTEATSRLDEAQRLAQSLADPQWVEALTAPYTGVDDSPQKPYLERVQAATSDLGTKLAALAAEAQSALDEARAAVNSAKGDWDAAVSPRREEYQQVLRDLHAQGLEPDKFVTVKEHLQALKAKEPRRKQLDDDIAALQADRGRLLGELKDHEKRQTESLHEAVRLANEATNKVVIVRPVPASDRSHIKSVVTRCTSGQRNHIMTAIEADDFSTRAFVEAARKGVEALASYGIKGAQAQSLLSAGEPLFRELEELSVGLAVDVQLDIGYGSKVREYRSMGQLSKGQKATALLLLLLSGSDAPLVIDQPEDDLDNRFVYDGIVTKLRSLKGLRQIVASTHNANVPVLGDAELIVTLEGDGQHGWPAADGIGSLDDRAIRSHAESILEGGPDAFNARQHLYGF